MSRVWGWCLFCGTRCRWTIPVPNTLSARTFGAGTFIVLQVIKCFCRDSHWVTYRRQVNTNCILPAFLEYLPCLILQELHGIAPYSFLTSALSVVGGWWPSWIGHSSPMLTVTFTPWKKAEWAGHFGEKFLLPTLTVICWPFPT